jgi:hypothetical protein
MENQNKIEKAQQHPATYKTTSVKSRVIEARTKKKITEYTDDQLGLMLIKIYLLVGINKQYWLQNEPLLVVLESIRSHKELSAEDFILAFELFSQQKLDYGQEKDDGHFQNFSPLWMNTVLMSYKRYRQKVNKENNINVVERDIVPLDERSTDEVYKASYEAIKAHIRDKNELPFGGNWINAYWHAEKNGLLLTLSLDEKQLFFDNTVEDVKHDLQKARLEQNITFVEICKMKLKSKKAMQNECRYKIIRKHFEGFLG